MIVIATSPRSRRSSRQPRPGGSAAGHAIHAVSCAQGHDRGPAEPVSRSRTNTSVLPFVSAGARLAADESKATKRPSSLNSGLVLMPSPCFPLLLRLTPSVLPLERSRTNTSTAPLVSPATRFAADESNATTTPSALADGALARPLIPSPCLPLLRTLTRSVKPREPPPLRQRKGSPTLITRRALSAAARTWFPVLLISGRDSTLTLTRRTSRHTTLGSTGRVEVGQFPHPMLARVTLVERVAGQSASTAGSARGSAPTWLWGGLWHSFWGSRRRRIVCGGRREARFGEA